MYTKGGYKEVLKLAFPAVISMISHSVMAMTDTIMVGKIGAREIAAVGLANIMIFTIYALFIGVIESLETIVSQRFGAGEKHSCAKAAWHGAYQSVVFGLVILLFYPLSGILFDVLAATETVKEIGASYFRIRIFGGGFFLLWTTFSSFFVGIQNTKTPMKISIMANVINISLDYVLIFGAFGLPRLGADGAALATVLANVVAVVTYVFLFLSRRIDITYKTRCLIRPDLLEFAKILKIGFPLGIEMLVRMISFLLFSAVIGRSGDMELAASQICIQIIRFSFMPGYGLSVATTTLVGKYIGAKNLNAATRSTKTSLVIGSLYALSLATVFLLLPKFLVGMVNTNPKVIATCSHIMYLAAFLQLFDIIAMISSGALRGAGDTKWIMKISTTYSWLLGLPIAIYFCSYAGLGAFGAWIGLTVETLFCAITFYWRFRQGKWKEVRI